MKYLNVQFTVSDQTKHTYIHTRRCNAVPLMWGLPPIKEDREVAMKCSQVKLFYALLLVLVSSTVLLSLWSTSYKLTQSFEAWWANRSCSMVSEPLLQSNYSELQAYVFYSELQSQTFRSRTQRPKYIWDYNCVDTTKIYILFFCSFSLKSTASTQTHGSIHLRSLLQKWRNWRKK